MCMGAQGVQQAVACRCLISVEAEGSATGHCPAGSCMVPATLPRTHTHTESNLHRAHFLHTSLSHQPWDHMDGHVTDDGASVTSRILFLGSSNHRLGFG